MKRIILLALSILATVPHSVFAEADVEYVIDVSGSMMEKLDGVTKMDAVKKALAESIREIDPKQLVALRVYGHRINQSNKKESCKDTELIIPFKQLDQQEFSSKTNPLQPKGWTPIAYSLEQTRNDLLELRGGRESEKIIILMTDGEETCGGDAIAVLKSLKNEGFKLKILTVGFNVNDLGRKQLQEIASFSGGKYFEAKDVVQLNESLKNAAKESVKLLNKPKTTYGNEIRGGNSYEQAASIEFGKEHKLDHHQKSEEYDYFYLDLKKNDQVTLTLKTLEKGINIGENGTIREDQSPHAGIRIHSSDRSEIQSMQIYAGQFQVENYVLRPKEDGRYYLLVGSSNGDMHKDHVNFQLELDTKGDLGTKIDAGSTIETALKIKAKKYDKNFIGAGDEVDYFSVAADAGDNLMIGIVPNATSFSSYFQVRLLSEFKEVIYQGNANFNAGFKSEEIPIRDVGYYYVEVTYDGDDQLEYSLILKRKQLSAGSLPTPGSETETPNKEEVR